MERKNVTTVATINATAAEAEELVELAWTIEKLQVKLSEGKARLRAYALEYGLTGPESGFETKYGRVTVIPAAPKIVPAKNGKKTADLGELSSLLAYADFQTLVQSEVVFSPATTEPEAFRLAVESLRLGPEQRAIVDRFFEVGTADAAVRFPKYPKAAK